MTSLFARRSWFGVAALVAALAVAALPSVASAKKSKGPKIDLGLQCSGSNIEMLGSTFQAPVDFVWSGYNWGKHEALSSGFNHNANTLACQDPAKLKGKEKKTKTKGTPTVRDNQEEPERGSGACLKDFGAGGTVRTAQFPICGTDEAPSAAKKGEMEEHGNRQQEAASIETIPVLQGAEAIIVHLPKNCLATSKPTVKEVEKSVGRLSLEQSVIEGIYRGTIKTWKKALEEQKSAHDKLVCTGEAGGKTGTEEEEERIHPVVRVDKSGTTHIFKEFLAQVNTASFQAEKFFHIKEGSGEHEKTGDPCGAAKEEESKTWSNVGEGCENQRWPAAAEVTRNENAETGNPGVVNQVNNEESSIGYADLAVAREYKFFSEAAAGGGEETPGEQHAKFWAYVQNNPHGVEPEYQEPASAGDNKTPADSNCKSTQYAANVGEEFPPKSTRDDWSPVKAERESKTYPICGLTYILAYRAYWYYLEPQLTGTTSEKEEKSKNIATTAANFLHFVVNPAAGGAEAANNQDYEALPSSVQKIAEEGVAEIGNKVG